MKKRTFPKEWYTQIYTELGFTDFRSEYGRKFVQRIKHFFCSGFTPEEILKCIPYLEKNPRFWHSNLKPILDIIRNEEIKASYSGKTENTGFSSLKELFNDPRRAIH